MLYLSKKRTLSSLASIDSNDSTVPGTPMLSPSGRWISSSQTPPPVPTYIFRNSATSFLSSKVHLRVDENRTSSIRIQKSGQPLNGEKVVNVIGNSIGSKKSDFKKIQSNKHISNDIMDVTNHLQETDYSEMNNSFKPSHIPLREPGGWICTRRTGECFTSVIKAISVAVKKERLRESKEKRSRRNTIKNSFILLNW